MDIALSHSITDLVLRGKHDELSLSVARFGFQIPTSSTLDTVRVKFLTLTVSFTINLSDYLQPSLTLRYVVSCSLLILLCSCLHSKHTVHWFECFYIWIEVRCFISLVTYYRKHCSPSFSFLLLTFTVYGIGYVMCN
jgi:hypothetical protein